MTDAEFETARAALVGQRQFILTAVCNGKIHRIQSGHATIEDREIVLGLAMKAVGVSIAKNFTTQPAE